MNTVKLGEICDIASGGTPSRGNTDYWQNGSIPWIKISNIKGKYVSEADEFITEEGLSGSSAKLFSKGTILYTIFATLGEVGILSIDACTNQAIAGITIKDASLVHQDYLYYYLKSQKSYVNGVGRGVAQNNINMSILRNFNVPLPNYDEQKVIVNTLDKIETVIEARKQELQKFDNLIKAQFVEMFGDVLENKKGFDTCLFGDYVNQMNIGPFGSDLKNECFVPREKGYCMVYEQKHAIDKDMSVEARYVDKAKYNQMRRFDIGPGDIIVSCRGTIGKCFILPEDAPHGIIHPSLMMIKPKSIVNNAFLVFLLERILEEQLEQGSGVKMAIKATELAKIRCIKPDKGLQDSYIAFVKQVDKSKFVVQQALDKAQLLFDSLMQQYFG